MKHFYVGQRVRVARPFHAQFSGYEAVIESLYLERPGYTYPVNCGLRGVTGDFAGTSSQCHTSRLKPILPSGAVPSEYSFTELMDKCREGIAA